MLISQNLSYTPADEKKGASKLDPQFHLDDDEALQHWEQEDDATNFRPGALVARQHGYAHDGISRVRMCDCAGVLQGFDTKTGKSWTFAAALSASPQSDEGRDAQSFTCLVWMACHVASLPPSERFRSSSLMMFHRTTSTWHRTINFSRIKVSTCFSRPLSSMRTFSVLKKLRRLPCWTHLLLFSRMLWKYWWFCAPHCMSELNGIRDAIGSRLGRPLGYLFCFKGGRWSWLRTSWLLCGEDVDIVTFKIFDTSSFPS